MEIIIGAILSYLISLASNLRSDAILATRTETLNDQLEQDEALRNAIESARPLRDEVRLACMQLARNRDRLGVTEEEQPLWELLSDEAFQADIVKWFMVGDIEEGAAAKNNLLQTMEEALVNAGASEDRIALLRTGYFDALDKAVFGRPILAHWRHQLGLDYLRGMVAELKRRAEEAAGIYSPAKQTAALDSYCEKALAVWDIIDLSNLPEGDIQMATQKLLLRQLYLPLRISVEPSSRVGGDDAALARLEEEREVRRHREAGHRLADKPNRSNTPDSRVPVGERLGISSRLVVLGEPGGGKTTMLRWMATAYLLKYKGDDAYSSIPDTQTLPDRSWIPVLIRCRDLGEADLCRSFTDFLTQHLNKTELLPEYAEVMRAMILDHIAKGKVLLLVDGLDEITNPAVRVMFFQELERTAARYPNAPIVVTSRIVGYRDMPFRMGSGFEHVVIAELSKEDKNVFARRWVEVTEQHLPTAERAERAQELIEALHSSDRIERLTGSPMLLTTLALVKRKVGKLPNRRSKLYAEAVSVLLNWNPKHYKIIEEEEAIPQLGYLAYEMCRRGVQRLTDDEVLDLLERVRTEYPNIRAIRRRKAHEFLELLEARSSILIKSGDIWENSRGQKNPVWEFRHLTFQEYLAARALIDGRYPERDKSKSLAEQVAPLVGVVQLGKGSAEEGEVPESWREVLRLLVGDSQDDDVDDVLLAILKPLPAEDSGTTARPRVALAGLCLADEPNVSEENAERILAEFAARINSDDGNGSVNSSLDRAAIEIGGSMWAPQLKKSLVQEYCERPPGPRSDVGSLLGVTEHAGWRDSGVDSQTFRNGLVVRLESGDRLEVISAALTVMIAAYRRDIAVAGDLPDCLLDLVASEDAPAAHAAAWALAWLGEGIVRGKSSTPVWVASGDNLSRVVQALRATSANEDETLKYLARVVGVSEGFREFSALTRWLNHTGAEVRHTVIKALVELGDRHAVLPLLAKLNDSDAGVRRAVVTALGRLGDKQAVPQLLPKLEDPDARTRETVIEALGRLGDKQAVPQLLPHLKDRSARVCKAVIEALGRLGDKQAVPQLLPKLEDSDARVRTAVIEALGRLGDEQTVLLLIPLLEHGDDQDCVAAAGALSSLGDDRGSIALREFLDHGSADRRMAAVRTLVRMRGDLMESECLSRDFDGVDPWMDPHTPISEARIEAAAHSLRMTPREVRSFFESIADDFHLRFA